VRLRTQRRELPSFSFSSSLFGAPFGFEANDGRKNFLLVLARVFSQFFFVPAPLLGRKKSLCWHQQRYKTQNALESAKEDGAVFVRTPPSSRAFPSSSSRFLLICSLPSSRARWGKFQETNREREKGRPFVFQQLVFFCFSLSLSSVPLSLLLSLSLLPCCCCFGVLVS